MSSPATTRTETINDQLDLLAQSIDTLWITVSTTLVFFMQAGFALLELGSVRMKNSQNILLKNILDITIATFTWWLVGYGIAFGQGGPKSFMGQDQYGGSGFNDNDTTHFRDWLFQWAFAGTAATIVSGAMAERTRLESYAAFSLLMTIVIYPTVVHWTWGGGWLTDLGFYDFAGSGIVHLTGGTAAFWAAYFLGPRLGRFKGVDQKEDDKLKEAKDIVRGSIRGGADLDFEDEDEDFRPHSIPFVVTGVFILWFGWYGFNCGSTLGITGDNLQLVSKVGMVTTVGAAAGGISSFVAETYLGYRKDQKSGESTGHGIKLAVAPGLTNGLLSGLVSITAGCSVFEPYAGFIVGFIGGLASLLFSKFLHGKKIRIDDPLDASSVHGLGGLWGVISVGFFHSEKGVFYGGSGDLLLYQIAGAVSIMAWTSAFAATSFFIFGRLGILRVSQDCELLGLDEWEHGGSAYVASNSRLPVFNKSKGKKNSSIPGRLKKRQSSRKATAGGGGGGTAKSKNVQYADDSDSDDERRPVKQSTEMV